MALRTQAIVTWISALIPLFTPHPAALAAGGGAVLADPGASQGRHFHPKGKGPSVATVELWLKNKGALPFDDTRDFDEAKKGFIAAPPYKQILQDDGTIVWICRATNGC